MEITGFEPKTQGNLSLSVNADIPIVEESGVEPEIFSLPARCVPNNTLPPYGSGRIRTGNSLLAKQMLSR